ncbi:DNA/RNA-binding protein KIN17 [Cryptotermes secundus]|uniref:DNA/RNA-binding protein KIN17 n=1 Tax=Cryptotermes secundus TaxID=105785 RepID=A0A2J7Q0T3_9NEOP|nr:DNA/RNA-binding protein KIN17 isoform X2 [Cryptotermes secundus]PNF22193.1 DNA/RNA-binding protein KIN17 [Cryptotermes secundus]PNF22194.1 DNA/RNA-binding protein KIN17 [Cryptotermes secundus]
MGKHEVGTPKYIANRIKAKGLQKLRWYCQMCEKQCRDENGFRCHMSSESHQRQLLLFADNTDKYINNFNKEFESGFLELLKRQFGTKRVHANRVYQDYIADRYHLHMNCTQWETLTDFVKWLGREGKCKVDETEKGWHVQYIDHDPETIAMQEALGRKEKLDRDDQEKMMAFIENQIEKGKEFSKNYTPVYAEFVRPSEEYKVVVNLKVETKSDEDMKNNNLLASNSLKNDYKRGGCSSSGNSKVSKNCGRRGEKRTLSALDEIIKDEENKKAHINRKDYWLVEGIVVKVIAKSLGEKYYTKKGVVTGVPDRYAATVTMLDSGHKLKLDQEHLETVIPAIGRPVRVVNGAYRGCSAILRELDQKKFCVTIEISSGPLKGRIVDRVEYGDIFLEQQLPENVTQSGLNKEDPGMAPSLPCTFHQRRSCYQEPVKQKACVVSEAEFGGIQ